MYRFLLITAFALPVAFAATPASAIHHHCNKCVTCPNCDACCELKVEKVDEEKHCWKVECEDICVPCWVFPWQNRHLRHGKLTCANGGCATGCAGCGGKNCSDGSCETCCKCPNHNGARIITVRKLKKEKYECPTCKYSWSPMKPGDCSDGCGADEGKGDDKKEEAKDEKVEEEAPEKPAEAPVEVAPPAPPEAPAPDALELDAPAGNAKSRPSRSPFDAARKVDNRTSRNQPRRPAVIRRTEAISSNGLVEAVVFDAE